MTASDDCKPVCANNCTMGIKEARHPFPVSGLSLSGHDAATRTLSTLGCMSLFSLQAN